MTLQDAIITLKREFLGDSEFMELAKQMGANALEKQIPKKVRETGIADGVCPCCNNAFYFDYSPKPNYCKKCGQALDWSDTE